MTVISPTVALFSRHLWCASLLVVLVTHCTQSTQVNPLLLQLFMLRGVMMVIMWITMGVMHFVCLSGVVMASSRLLKAAMMATRLLVMAAMPPVNPRFVATAG